MNDQITPPVVAVGDQVVYSHQHYVHKVDQYDARVVAVNPDGSLDLSVFMGYLTIVRGIHFDNGGRPSSWRTKQPGQALTEASPGGITTQTGFGSQSTHMIGGA